MLARGTASIIAKRGFATASAESPKVTLARNILRLNQISAAKNEEELKKIVAAPLPTVDVSALPKELSSLQSYFSFGSALGSGNFTADPNAWQNKDFFSFAADEVGRKDTWPFFVGFVAVNLLLGFGIAAALPADARKNSKYAQLLEGKGHGHGHDDDHHAHH